MAHTPYHQEWEDYEWNTGELATPSFEEVFVDPFADQWLDLGYAHWSGSADTGWVVAPEILYEEFGGAFFQPDQIERQMAINQQESKWNSMTDTFDMWAVGAIKELETKEEGFEQTSKYGIKNLERNIEFATIQNERDKSKLVIETLTNLDTINNRMGKRGLASGNIEKDIALDAVKSKINAANTSHAISRKETKHDIDNIKNRFGYTDEEGNWISGYESDTLALQFDAQYGTKLQGLENRFGVMNHQLNMTVNSIYDDWLTAQYGLISDIFSYAPGYDPCGEGRTWNATEQKCV